LRQPGREALLAEIDVMLDHGEATSRDNKLADYLAGCANLSDYIVSAIDRHGAKQTA
jgi:hypothetical protein